MPDEPSSDHEQPTSASGTRPRGAVLGVAAAVALALVISAGAVLGAVVASPDNDEPEPRTVTIGQGGAAVEITNAELQAMTSVRSSALARQDVNAFLAPLDQNNKALLAEQKRLFDNLSRVDFATRQYNTIEQVGRSADRFGRAVTVQLDVAFVHQIRGYDAHPVAEWYRWTVVKKDPASTPVITAIGAAPATSASHSRSVFYPAPWDKWDLQVVATPHVYFLVDKPMLAMTRRYAPTAEKAAEQTVASWRGSGAPGRVFDRYVTSMVPNRKELGSVYQITDDKATEAGRTMVMERYGGASGTIGSTRVVIDASSTFFSGRREASEEIFRHEYAHAMIEPLNTHKNPDLALGRQQVWIIEGFAEYVANRGAGVGGRTHEGAVYVRSAEFTGKLPGPFGFYDDTFASERYYLAHQAYRYIAKTAGEKNVYAFAAAYYGGASVDDALRSVLQVDIATFERGWAAFVRAEAQ